MINGSNGGRIASEVNNSQFYIKQYYFLWHWQSTVKSADLQTECLCFADHNTTFQLLAFKNTDKTTYKKR